MADAFLDIEIDSTDLERTFKYVDAALSPAGLATFLNTEVVEWLQRRAEERFAEEGDDASGPWAPLTDTTQKIRESLGYLPSGPINVRTGQLKEHVVGGRGDIGMDEIGSTLEFPGGTINPELQMAFEGAQLGGSKHPARPVAAVDMTDAAAVLTMLSNFILGPALRGEVI